MQNEMTDAQFYIFSQHRAKEWDLVDYDGERVIMRKDLSTSPHVKSYQYITILPTGMVKRGK